MYYNRNNRNNATTNFRGNNKSYDNSNNRESSVVETNNAQQHPRLPALVSNYDVAVGVPAVASLVSGLVTGHPIIGTLGMIPAAALGDVLYYKFNKR
jgi:hypothetical protein